MDHGFLLLLLRRGKVFARRNVYAHQSAHDRHYSLIAQVLPNFGRVALYRVQNLHKVRLSQQRRRLWIRGHFCEQILAKHIAKWRRLLLAFLHCTHILDTLLQGRA